ncbi:MAG: hypothetical protein IIC87_06975 [Chloroflexi bacterium]|nr:hypothetical protein [Chloroflexota bacterium]
MAKLVVAVGAPHRPAMPQQAAQSPGQHAFEGQMKQVREQLEAAAPDVIIEMATDHFTNFFYNNMPAFCLGLAPEAEGPEPSVNMPHYTVQGSPDLARALLAYSLRSRFDLAVTEEVILDHSILVPLHFLTPSMTIPVVPLYINGIAPPFPRAARCYALGQTIRRFVEQWDADKRVALVVSGSFAIEVGGPRAGWVDQKWADTIRGLLEGGQYRSLARRATQERMAAAGNASGELLNWITMTGAVGDARPLFVETDSNGNGYAAWKLE